MAPRRLSVKPEELFVSLHNLDGFSESEINYSKCVLAIITELRVISEPLQTRVSPINFSNSLSLCRPVYMRVWACERWVPHGMGGCTVSVYACACMCANVYIYESEQGASTSGKGGEDRKGEQAHHRDESEQGSQLSTRM